ncbi:MAG TPA: hypothetical protein ENH65_09205 [Candidatus Aminicenantes bacterium]|nr:hypothetical protein [Candidatus Aminicenantes bacterium]
MSSGGPDFQPVPQGRDIQGEQNILGTGGEFLKFLRGGATGEALGGFDLPLQQLTDALQGQATGFLRPLIARGTEESLLAQGSAIGDIERFGARQAGGRGQFGIDRLRAQTGSEFARQRAGIPLNVFTNTIQNFLPLLAQKVAAESQLAQGALQGGQQFSRVSGGRQAQAINRIQAGQPPESKDLGGVGAALSIAAILATGGTATPLVAAGAAGAGAGAFGPGF